ncbi:hypothetical protein BUL40_04935 [Croceivirga radicis]|uniref:Uncharacterized protein n=1 Tax=Croceivirga radicis TaxID=1929488 RepID=A0A1V6LUW0_9FLAO|nr:hypothetical protein BUL40_04935 [Croceivirga radicis]
MDSTDDFDGTWTALTGVPTDLLDGDADTQYTAGAGLTLTGTEFAVDATTLPNFGTTDLTQTATEDRNYNINGNDLFFRNGQIGIGALAGAPQSMLDVNGQIQARDGFAANTGSVTNPHYGFATNGDTNTGMYRISEDNLGFTTGGIEALRIDDNQNVGVGSTNPTSKLDIAGSVAKPITVENTSITLDETNYTVILDGTTAIILPMAGTCEGRVYRIIARGNSYTLNINILDSDGGGIDETSGTTRNLVLQSDGTNWYQIN